VSHIARNEEERMSRVAFYTFGILRAARGHTQVQGFVDRVPDVFAAAADAPGYIVRLPDRTTEERQRNPHFFNPCIHTGVALTLSVWADLASVYAYAYGGLHREALQKRGEWFVPPQWPPYAAWWVGDDELPTYTDAIARIEHLHDCGPTPDAFTFRHPFDAQGAISPTHRSSASVASGSHRTSA